MVKAEGMVGRVADRAARRVEAWVAGERAAVTGAATAAVVGVAAGGVGAAEMAAAA